MGIIKAKSWDGKDLVGPWHITMKIDGVRAIWNPIHQEWFSRAGKPLYNIPYVKTVHGQSPVDCEVYINKSFKDTISATRSKLPKTIDPKDVYHLFPTVDYRLSAGSVMSPTAQEIETLLKRALSRGFEGLILRQNDVWLKVKPVETYDVAITGWGCGKGKYTGMLGYLETGFGKVGSGFTDADRKELYLEGNKLMGQIVEVSFMELTDAGKFRHPRFIRMRPDKG